MIFVEFIATHSCICIDRIGTYCGRVASGRITGRRVADGRITDRWHDLIQRSVADRRHALIQWSDCFDSVQKV